MMKLDVDGVARGRNGWFNAVSISVGKKMLSDRFSRARGGQAYSITVESSRGNDTPPVVIELTAEDLASLVLAAGSMIVTDHGEGFFDVVMGDAEDDKEW